MRNLKVSCHGNEHGVRNGIVCVFSFQCMICIKMESALVGTLVLSVIC